MSSPLDRIEDGGCPFCGHGFVPKPGFRWPKSSDRKAQA